MVALCFISSLLEKIEGGSKNQGILPSRDARSLSVDRTAVQKVG